MKLVRNIVLAGLVGAALTLGGAARAEDGYPQPGYWQVTNVLAVIRKVELRCLVASEINKFMTGPSNRHYACTYPIRDVGNGRINLKGSCTTKAGQVANISAAGTYSLASFRLKGTLSTRIAGIPISGEVMTDARRLAGICPPTALRSDEARRVLGASDAPPL